MFLYILLLLGIGHAIAPQPQFVLSSLQLKHCSLYTVQYTRLYDHLQYFWQFGRLTPAPGARLMVAAHLTIETLLFGTEDI
jgi:hypothetical protein